MSWPGQNQLSGSVNHTQMMPLAEWLKRKVLHVSRISKSRRSMMLENQENDNY